MSVPLEPGHVFAGGSVEGRAWIKLRRAKSIEQQMQRDRVSALLEASRALASKTQQWNFASPAASSLLSSSSRAGSSGNSSGSGSPTDRLLDRVSSYLLSEQQQPPAFFSSNNSANSRKKPRKPRSARQSRPPQPPSALSAHRIAPLSARASLGFSGRASIRQQRCSHPPFSTRVAGAAEVAAAGRRVSTRPLAGRFAIDQHLFLRRRRLSRPHLPAAEAKDANFYSNHPNPPSISPPNPSESLPPHPLFVAALSTHLIKPSSRRNRPGPQPRPPRASKRPLPHSLANCFRATDAAAKSSLSSPPLPSPPPPPAGTSGRRGKGGKGGGAGRGADGKSGQQAREEAASSGGRGSTPVPTAAPAPIPPFSPGLYPGTLRALPVTRPSLLQLKHLPASEVCCVCLESLSRDPSNQGLISLPACKHTFHKECITRWLLLSKQCPMCKGAV